MSRTSPVLRAGGFVLALVTSSACVVSVNSQALNDRVEKRFPVKGTPELSLITFDGSIEIRSWDRPEVLVEIEKRGSTQELLDSIEVVAGVEDGRIRVEARAPSRGQAVFAFNVSRSARIIASVPRTTNLLARSGDGAISIERVSGRLELRTGDGSISGYDLKGDLTLNSGDGSVKLEAIEGRVDASTGDGGMALAGKLEAVRLRTSDGSIALRVEQGSTLSENWDVSTGDGGVVLYLPSDFAAELDAHTGDGAVRADRDLGLLAQDEKSRHSIRGRLGAGGRALRVRSGDGSISLRSTGDRVQVERQ